MESLQTIASFNPAKEHLIGIALDGIRGQVCDQIHAWDLFPHFRCPPVAALSMSDMDFATVNFFSQP